MQRFIIVGAVALIAGSMGVTRVATLEGDLQRLEEFSRTNPKRTLLLENEVQRLEAELDSTLQNLAALNAENGADKDELQLRIVALEASLVKAAQKLASQGMALYDLKQDPAQLDDRIQRLELGVEDRLTATVGATEALVAEARAEFASQASEDVETRWQQIVAPTVQLSGETTVGSGVLLKSRELADGHGHETLVLTAWHVVRDILADAGSEEAPIPVSIFDNDGISHSLTASLLCREPDMDAALLRLNTNEPIDHGAELASRTELGSRRVFHDLYAVGCPLGNDPIPTRGEIADLTHVVDGTTYWMISAPTYIGNSGGGIYDAKSKNLMGLFSKIYTHGNIRPTVVPHMGLVTPLAPFYDWLEDQGHAQVLESSNGVTLIPTSRP